MHEGGRGKVCACREREGGGREGWREGDREGGSGGVARDGERKCGSEEERQKGICRILTLGKWYLGLKNSVHGTV